MINVQCELQAVTAPGYMLADKVTDIPLHLFKIIRGFCYCDNLRERPIQRLYYTWRLLKIFPFIMQKRDENQDFMSCTAPALAVLPKLPRINIPYDLQHALKYIYGLKQNSTSCSNLCNNYMRCINSLSNIQKITQQNYLIILKICLCLVQFEVDLEMERHKLLNQRIKKSDFNNFIIDTQSLNSKHTVIRPNDSASLHEPVTRKIIWAQVVNVFNEQNYITIKPYHLKDVKILENEENKFNITFRTQHWPLRCCHYALMIMGKRDWIQIIYPQLKTDCTDMEFDIEWINTNIKENQQQKQAVKKILNKTAYPAPYIIFGPPGTGKTATLVETICQIVRQFPKKNILICTVSNAAADEITKRLIKNIPTKLIYRMYAPSRDWTTVDAEIRPCANFVEKTTLFLSKELLILKKIVITTLVSSTRLIGINLSEDHFSYIMIDEASQATEPEMLIPLTIANKIEDESTGFQAQIVIAGDPYQLGPVVLCRKIEHLLGRSMLERLMNDCDPYKRQNGKYNPNYITKLVRNYRSHENLLYVSNKQFYSNELMIFGGPNTQMALNWSYLPNKKFPMIFQEVLGTEERIKGTRSVYNTAEVLAVLIYVDLLMRTNFKDHTITPKDIGIITPFKQQQLDISHYLAAMNLKDITVGTVEVFQGQERNVIILSTVRSKIFTHDGREHVGFLSNPKRFNVALTRAKVLTIVIGNPAILCKNEHWEVLWEYCKKHDGYVPFEQLPIPEDILAKLKSNSEADSDNNSDASNTTKLSITMKYKEEERRTKTLFDILMSKMKNLSILTCKVKALMLK